MTPQPTDNATQLDDLTPPRSADKVRGRIASLAGQRDLLAAQHKRATAELEKARTYLAIHEKVGAALEALNEQLFRELLGLIEDKLTIALQEVLDQPIRLRATADWKRAGATVEFWIERDGQAEDIMRGQGGSVANILSVGLRMFALTTLDEQQHQRFLVLDEQDCWLRPDLVPRLVKIVHEAGKALGFQTLMISHHDTASFIEFADKIYQFSPNTADGVTVDAWRGLPEQPDLDGGSDRPADASRSGS
jgi:DNA repair exonuclease SbcCD ATPase subunit